MNRPLCSLVTALGLCSSPAAGQDQPAAGELELTVERAMIFKDGHALIAKRGRGVLDDQGQLATTAVPGSVVLGTFWAWSADEPVIGLRAEPYVRTETTEREVSCATTAELLEANVGRDVALVLEQSRLEGKLLAFLAGDVRPNARGGSPPSVLLSVEREDGATTLGLPVTEIRWVEGRDLATTLTRRDESEVPAKRLTLEFGAAAAGRTVELRLMYFTPDVRWIPTYRLEGALVDSADLTLQGELLNELEDLSGAALDLVVGVPHFRFQDTISPLSLESAMTSALAQAAPQLMSQVSAGSNGFLSNSLSVRSGERRNTGAAPDVPDELSGGEESDLYVFSLEPRRFPKGARLTAPLFHAPVALRHLHTLDIEVGHDNFARRFLQSSSARAADGSPLRLERSEVWHQLELRNESEHPWTTGAALVLRREAGGVRLPLGQDLLTYTPRGGTCELPVTIAVGVRSRHDEEELARDVNALRWNNDSYSKIRKRGTLRISNAKTTAVELRVRLSTGGKVTSTTDDGRVTLDDFHAEDWGDRGYQWRLNQHSDVAWDVVLAPGEERTLEYEFEYFTR